jgi:hypothetical protein
MSLYDVQEVIVHVLICINLLCKLVRLRPFSEDRIYIYIYIYIYILMLSPQEPCHMFTKREKYFFPPQFDNKASIESKLLLFVTHKKAKLIPNLKVHYASYLR